MTTDPLHSDPDDDRRRAGARAAPPAHRAEPVVAASGAGGDAGDRPSRVAPAARDGDGRRGARGERAPTPSGGGAAWRRAWRATVAWTRALARHRDPLVEASNWVAILIGTHLPFWPLYVWWSAGRQAFPTALLTVALTPVFLVIPLVARRNGWLGRVATPLAGVANTVFTVWILGANSGTVLFLAPCSALAAFSFRRGERWTMLVMTTLPLLVYFALQQWPPVPLHRYGPDAVRSLFALNVISVGVIGSAFGWLLADTYRRMEGDGNGARALRD